MLGVEVIPSYLSSRLHLCLAVLASCPWNFGLYFAIMNRVLLNKLEAVLTKNLANLVFENKESRSMINRVGSHVPG